MEFRKLRADEIQVRPANREKTKYLLYQDARCATNILDETLTPFNWQVKYEEHKGNLFCYIGVKNTETNEWIWKGDAGSESQVEKEKGEASDAFKRAAVKWGIGRELYTAPSIYIPNGDASKVTSISYTSNGFISSLDIADNNGNNLFRWVTPMEQMLINFCKSHKENNPTEWKQKNGNNFFTTFRDSIREGGIYTLGDLEVFYGRLSTLHT